MTRYLVPIDFSGITETVLATVQDLARSDSATITLLHVVESNTEPASLEAGPQSVRDRVSMQTHERHRTLQEYARHLTQSGATAQALLVQGDIADEILRHAKKENVDIIIVGRHGHGGLLTRLLGTVSEAILHRSPCPVLIVPEKK